MLVMISSVIGNGMGPNPVNHMFLNEMPPVGLRVSSSYVGSSRPVIRLSVAYDRFTFNESWRSAALKIDWFQLSTPSLLQSFVPAYSAGSPMLLPALFCALEFTSRAPGYWRRWLFVVSPVSDTL